VLLYALAPINVRNMLRSGPLDELLARGARVVVVSPLADDPAFQREFTRDRVAVQHVPEYTLGALQRRLDSVALERFVRLHPTSALRVRWQRHENVAASRLRGPASFVKILSGRAPVPPGPLLRAVDALIPPAAYEPVFQRHRPDVVAIASAWQVAELPWTVGARRWRIPSLAIDMNWDSFESKAGIIRGPDGLLVWSASLRDKAIRRFSYESKAIQVTGAPQFDWYFHRRGIADRATFLAKLGFPQETKLITLATVLNTQQDPDRLELLHRWLADGRFGPSARILVRLHPADSLARWASFRGLPGIHIEHPFRDLPDGVTPRAGESLADMRHKVETLVHTDVLVNVNSTIAFEAMLVDLPTVMVAFDGKGIVLPYHQSDVRFLDYEHIQDLVAAGGVRIARTPGELAASIATYLEGRHVDRELRRRAAERLYGWHDGGAGARVAEAVLGAVTQGPLQQETEHR